MKLSLPLLFVLALTPLAHADEEGKDITIEQFLQTLSSVPEVVQRRDPFVEVPPPFEIPPPEESGDGPVMSAPVLERYPITDYEVVAVLLGDKYPRALLRMPKENTLSRKVLIVKEGDKLGSRKGVVSRIVAEGVMVQQAQRSKHGFVDKTEVLLKVGGQMDDQRKSLLATTGQGKKK